MTIHKPNTTIAALGTSTVVDSKQKPKPKSDKPKPKPVKLPLIGLGTFSIAER